MSCKLCEKQQEGKNNSIFYKWKDTTIELKGCHKHIREIIDLLSKEQNLTKK